MAEEKPTMTKGEADALKRCLELFDFKRKRFCEAIGLSEGGHANKLYARPELMTEAQLTALWNSLLEIYDREKVDIDTLRPYEDYSEQEKRTVDRGVALRHFCALRDFRRMPSAAELHQSVEDSKRVSIMAAVQQLDGHDLTLVQDLCKTLERYRGMSKEKS